MAEARGLCAEDFSQVPSENPDSPAGLGIGLSLARGLVELHGGRITAHSAGVGYGSEFTVRLPLADPQILTGVSITEPTAQAPPAGRYRILVVDDLRDSADSLAMALRSHGHEVEVAYHGEEAVWVAEEFLPDVAFIDLGMPQVDGYEVCRRIRSRPWGVGMLLVAQTGWGQEFDRRRTQVAGFNHHLVKPLEWSVVEGVLRRVRPRPASPSA